MKRTVGIALIVACAVLSLAVVALSVALYQEPRFIETRGDNPYIMFDNKTAQTCWAGTSDDPLAAYGGKEITPQPNSDAWSKAAAALQARSNPPHLPFCKDLK